MNNCKDCKWWGAEPHIRKREIIRDHGRRICGRLLGDGAKAFIRYWTWETACRGELINRSPLSSYTSATPAISTAPEFGCVLFEASEAELTRRYGSGYTYGEMAEMESLERTRKP